MIVKDLFNFLNNLYPTDTACDFDNVGILVGDEKAEVKKALIALDCRLETVKKAKENDCDLIITHHPVIFKPLSNVLSGSTVFELIKNGISVISMHTNLDIADGGVSEKLCEKLGLTKISTVTASDGFLLKSGIISPTKPQNFAERIKKALNTNVKFVKGKNEITKVLVCSGSGGEFLEDAISFGYDAYVTSEIKHHQFLEAADKGISLFDAGHFNTEDIIVEPLKDLLSNEFKDIEFITYHDDIIKQI